MLVKCLHKKLYPCSCKVDSLKRLRPLPGVETFIKIRPLSAWANIWRACSVALAAPSTNRFYLESRVMLSTSNYPCFGLLALVSWFPLPSHHQAKGQFQCSNLTSMGPSSRQWRNMRLPWLSQTQMCIWWTELCLRLCLEIAQNLLVSTEHTFL